MSTAADADLAALHQDLTRLWNCLAAAPDAHSRAILLIDAADLHHQLATVQPWFATAATPLDDGHTIAASFVSSADLLDALADVELVAGGSLRRRHATDTAFEPVAGPVLDRMAATPDVTGRAELLGELHAAVEPVVGRWAADVLRALPYAPGMTGWDHDEPQPWALSLRAVVRVVRAGWRRVGGAR